MKKWERQWKLELIERFNPDWQDLYETLNALMFESLRRRALDPRFRGGDKPPANPPP